MGVVYRQGDEWLRTFKDRTDVFESEKAAELSGLGCLWAGETAEPAAVKDSANGALNAPCPLLVVSGKEYEIRR